MRTEEEKIARHHLCHMVRLPVCLSVFLHVVGPQKNWIVCVCVCISVKQVEGSGCSSVEQFGKQMTFSTSEGEYEERRGRYATACLSS